MYYDVLGVARDAPLEEIRRAYRREALKWHPDRVQGVDRATAQSKFNALAEAYEVLADVELRGTFDRVGEQGLKTGRDGVSSGYRFRDNAAEIFAQFFGTSNPYATLFDVDGPEFAALKRRTGTADKASDVELSLVLTLEDFYCGTAKKIQYERRVLNADNITTSAQQALLAVSVKPGLRAGTKLTYPKQGNQAPGVAPGDVVLTLTEAPHDVYTRASSGLRAKLTIDLATALCGGVAYLPTLDGRQLAVPVNDVVQTGDELTMAGEGMPHSADPTQKDNLVVEFVVKFPRALSSDKKARLRELLLS